VTAGAAFQANICAQTGDIPFIPAAWVRLTQTDNVVELQVREHDSGVGKLTGERRKLYRKKVNGWFIEFAGSLMFPAD